MVVSSVVARVDSSVEATDEMLVVETAAKKADLSVVLSVAESGLEWASWSVDR